MVRWTLSLKWDAEQRFESSCHWLIKWRLRSSDSVKRVRQQCRMHKITRRQLFVLLFATALAASGCGSKHIVRAAPPSVSTPPPEVTAPMPQPTPPPPLETQTEEPLPEAPLPATPSLPAKRPPPRPRPVPETPHPPPPNPPPPPIPPHLSPTTLPP